jgi:malate synthase
MRYGIMFTVKSPTSSNRKITVMDFQKARQITFTVNETESEEMEEDLKEFIRGHLEKVETGYWDYTGSHTKSHKSFNEN